MPVQWNSSLGQGTSIGSDAGAPQAHHSKGGGKSAATASSGMITGPPDGLNLKMRQQLNDQGQVDRLKKELEQKIDEARAVANGKHPAMSFHDFDISQNKIPVEDLCDIFMLLSQSDIRVVRLRLFGCPTMNDEAAMVLGNWFAGVSVETAPLELHLSDCALTTIGFLGLTGAIRDNPAFPPLGESGKREPMYLRLENNYIDKETLQDIITEGTCCTFTKKDWGWGSWGKAHFDGAVPENTKIKLLTGQDHVSHQKTGEPPSLDQAPRYKNVINWSKGEDGFPCKGKGKMGKDEWRDSTMAFGKDQWTKGCGKIGKDPWMDSSGKGYGKSDFGYGWKGYGESEYDGKGFDGDSGKGYGGLAALVKGKAKEFDSWGKGKNSWMSEGEMSAPPRAMSAYQPRHSSYGAARADLATTGKAPSPIGGQSQDRSRTPPPLRGSLAAPRSMPQGQPPRAVGLQPPKSYGFRVGNAPIGQSGRSATPRPKPAGGPTPPNSAPPPRPVEETAEGGPADIDFSTIDAEIAAAAHAATGESLDVWSIVGEDN